MLVPILLVWVTVDQDGREDKRKRHREEKAEHNGERKRPPER